MAITAAVKINEAPSNNASSYTTGASLAAIAGRLYMMAAGWSGTNLRAFTSFVHNATTNPCTFTKIGDVTSNTTASPVSRTVTCRGMNTADSNLGNLTLNIAGTVSRAVIVVVEFDGVDTSGSGGSGAILSSNDKTNRADGSTGINIIFNAFGAADNRPFVVASSDLNGSFTPDSTYTELTDLNPGEVFTLETQWDNNTTPGTVCTVTPNASADLAAIGHEIVAAAAISPNTAHPTEVLVAIIRGAYY